MLSAPETLQARGVGHGYGGRFLFRDLSFSLVRGMSLALTGPSGSGKTTMLSILGGLIRPDEGTAVLSKGPGSASGPFAWTDVAWVFQGGNLFPWRSVLDNALLGLSGTRGVDHSAATERARSLLGEVGLGHRLSNRARVLSGGERQRLGIVRALVPRPAFILADEPTSGMDLSAGRVVIDLLIEMVRKHKTGLVVCTHDASVSGQLDRRVDLA